MKLKIAKVFRHYFPNSFEMYMVGAMFLIFSFPGIGLIFIHHDPIFPEMITNLRGVGIVWGLATCLIGLFLLFCAVRNSAPAGTLAFRLTHPRLLPRDE
jgi:hypothetical protein